MDYVRATSEQPHPVPDFYVDGDKAYCSRCSYAIVTPAIAKPQIEAFKNAGKSDRRFN